MNLTRINIWTNCLYTTIHSIYVAKQINFGNLQYVHLSVDNAKNWVKDECSYKSILLPYVGKNKKIEFRKDPNETFPLIVNQIVKMFIVDLAIILDEYALEVLNAKSIKAGRYPQSKIEQLRKNLTPNYDWAADGCLELIAVRNSLVHNNGLWNAKTINIVKKFISPTPKINEKITIGFPMLFRYKKAIRTFINAT